MALTDTVAGDVVPEEVAVSQSAFEVTLNGTVLPVPMVETWNVCDGILAVVPACPLKLSDVGDTLRTGLAVTTSVTGIAVTVPPETATESSVL